jgi:hypothetical protein
MDGDEVETENQPETTMREDLPPRIAAHPTDQKLKHTRSTPVRRLTAAKTVVDRGIVVPNLHAWRLHPAMRSCAQGAIHV